MDLLTAKPYVADEKFTNAIRTTKYTWLSFIPLNLFEQFHNLANVYFLILTLLQTVPSISITNGKPLIAAPLAFVLAVSAAKDLWEDRKRGSADAGENNSMTRVTDSVNDSAESARDLPWSKVRVGHVLVVKRNERFPSDMVLVESSDGLTCNVETMNLDGETNLKQKNVVIPEGQSWNTLARSAHMQYEKPSAELYEFKGVIIDSSSNGMSQCGIGINGLLLRGSSLQHTEWVKGVVVYCGHDSRVMRNSQGSRFKTSMLDDQLNKIMIFVFALMITLSLCGGFGSAMWMTNNAADAWYLGPNVNTPPFTRWLISSGTWGLQLGNMVPISMLVTLTTVKFLQGKLLEMDETCFDAKRGTYAEAHTSQVLESLGQLTHVFSDKTGTLTCNEMVYKNCSTAGQIYPQNQQTDQASLPTMADSSVDFGAGAHQILVDLADPAKQSTITKFLLCHALCHTLTVDSTTSSTAGGGGSAAPKPVYAAASPDELALVSAARVIGLAFFQTSQTSMTLHVTDKRIQAGLEVVCGSAGQPAGTGYTAITFELLAICDFDNDRKRMSAVFRFPNGNLVLFVKGADSSMLPYTAKNHQDSMTRDLASFATTGLRTLCLCSRNLNPSDFGRWNERYRAALASVSDDRSQQVHKLACEIETERELELLGATAIEDRLQDGVPDTIERLRLAGITVWVLTGDKVETAINIGLSSKLLTDSMVNTVVDGKIDEIHAALEKHSKAGEHAGGKAITITGAALAIVLANANMIEEFYRACLDCQSVLACRVSPKQKADVVQLAQSLHRKTTGVEPVTLAIGDGANDVAMITAAQVGVGLSGKEGAQAARAADFAFAQFRFLSRLIFVHGLESYRRNSTLVNYNFYKNLVLVLPPLFYGPMMTFSGQPFYDQAMYQLYNMIFTSFPIMVYALMDRARVDLSHLESNPSMYAPGIRKEFFNLRVFFLWFIAAVLQAIWVLALALACFANDGMWVTGAEVFSWVILGVNLTLMMQLTMMFHLTFIVLAGSVLSYPISLLVLEAIGISKNYTSSVVISPRSCLVTLLFVPGFLGLGEAILGLIRYSKGHVIDIKEGMHASEPVHTGFGFSKECQIEMGHAGRQASTSASSHGGLDGSLLR
eukprot:TRINITY_DN9960_c1_g1_i1.p1 TRINITY_DN9960_c1_g1~~TRINITY_DN9960_c1_g1_i1.p1  ORF type:complete len:1119 (+),score=148.26 TRINITY_DN9960_c1_g1_i1:74-3430(+)